MDNVALQQNYANYLFDVVRGFNHEHALFVKNLQTFKRGGKMSAQEVDENINVLNSIYHYATVAHNILGAFTIEDMELQNSMQEAYDAMVECRDPVLPLRLIQNFAVALNACLVYVIEHPSQKKNDTVTALVNHGIR